MNNSESPRGKRRSGEGAATGMAKYEGLEQTLYSLCSPLGDEATRMSVEQLVHILANDRATREEAKNYLSPGGRGYERDAEVADAMRERLAWKLLDFVLNGSRSDT